MLLPACLALPCLPAPSFPFQSHPHECKKKRKKTPGRKLITAPRMGKWARGMRLEHRAKEMEEEGYREENTEIRWGPFLQPSFCSSQKKCPLILFPTLSVFHQDSPMNGITDKAISRVTQIYFGRGAIVYFPSEPGAICLGTIWFP